MNTMNSTATLKLLLIILAMPFQVRSQEATSDTLTLKTYRCAQKRLIQREVPKSGGFLRLYQWMKHVSESPVTEADYRFCKDEPFQKFRGRKKWENLLLTTLEKPSDLQFFWEAYKNPMNCVSTSHSAGAGVFMFGAEGYKDSFQCKSEINGMQLEYAGAGITPSISLLHLGAGSETEISTYEVGKGTAFIRYAPGLPLYVGSSLWRDHSELADHGYGFRLVTGATIRPKIIPHFRTKLIYGADEKILMAWMNRLKD